MFAYHQMGKYANVIVDKNYFNKYIIYVNANHLQQLNFRSDKNV